MSGHPGEEGVAPCYHRASTAIMTQVAETERGASSERILRHGEREFAFAEDLT
jgi:hypothetical protein